MSAYPYLNRPRIFLTAAIGFAAAFIAAGLIFLVAQPPRGSGHADLRAAINDQIAKLNVEPRKIELTSEKAQRVRNAIKHDNFRAANEIVADVLANSHLQNWRFYPFGDFIVDITNVNDPTLESHLNEWVVLNKNNAIPLLIRAQYYFDMGWLKRGDSYARQIRADHLAAFQDSMNEALADADAAIRLNPDDPYGFYLKLRILLGLGMRAEMQSAFEQAIARYPGYFQLYAIVLRALEPKWGGTVQAMYAFVDQYAGRAADHSPLKLLYLNLYSDLLDTAAGVCAAYGRDKAAMAQCVASVMQQIITPALEDDVPVALQLYSHSDRYQFGLIVEAILFGMLKTAGGDMYSGAILQLAATAMNSDTQLKEDKPGANNYIIDEAVSESWYLKGFYDNALKKDQEALKDAESAVFPSLEAKDLAVAKIYEYIGGTYNKLNRYTEMIAYERAAIALGNVTADEHFICYGFFRLKDNEAAVRACTKTIEDQPGNLQARYWRGDAYRDLGQTDDALRDLTVVAESESAFRTYAAIDLSMVYFGRNDDQSALDALNKYKYLYDADVNNRENIAVSYNNRCYAYMQLGQLREALDDCRASLKYGNLPDAYRKEQELVKRIAAGQKGL